MRIKAPVTAGSQAWFWICGVWARTLSTEPEPHACLSWVNSSPYRARGGWWHGVVLHCSFYNRATASAQHSTGGHLHSDVHSISSHLPSCFHHGSLTWRVAVAFSSLSTKVMDKLRSQRESYFTMQFESWQRGCIWFGKMAHTKKNCILIIAWK